MEIIDPKAIPIEVTEKLALLLELFQIATPPEAVEDPENGKE